MFWEIRQGHIPATQGSWQLGNLNPDTLSARSPVAAVRLSRVPRGARLDGSGVATDRTSRLAASISSVPADSHWANLVSPTPMTAGIPSSSARIARCEFAPP
jgi:hypothetical protein